MGYELQRIIFYLLIGTIIGFIIRLIKRRKSKNEKTKTGTVPEEQFENKQ